MQYRLRPAGGPALALGAGTDGASTAVATKFDPVSHRLTVAGQVFRFGPYFPTTTLKQRQVVRLRYGWSRGRRTAMRILPVTAKASALRSLHPAKPRQASS